MTAERGNPKRVLVTGAAGFIGRALVHRLRESGAAITVTDVRPFRDDDVESIVGDLRDDDVVRACFEAQPEEVYHLAARTSVLQSMEDPLEVFDINVAVTQRLLDAARDTGTPSFVLASTNAVVGAVDQSVRIDERTPLRPLTPYGATKAAAEMLGSAYAASYGMAIAAVRLSNVYGPGMTEKDSFIARLLRAATTDAQVTIYGDGNQVRDYVFVDDAVAGLLLAGARGVRGPLVIASGTSTSVLEVYELVRSVTGSSLPSARIEAPRGEMRAVRVDIGRARGFGYAPRVGLKDGVTRAWHAWVSELDRASMSADG
jgi:UDP-glucose 4-epimerase